MIDLLISYEKFERKESSRKDVLKPISNSRVGEEKEVDDRKLEKLERVVVAIRKGRNFSRYLPLANDLLTKASSLQVQRPPCPSTHPTEVVHLINQEQQPRRSAKSV